MRIAYKSKSIGTNATILKDGAIEKLHRHKFNDGKELYSLNSLYVDLSDIRVFDEKTERETDAILNEMQQLQDRITELRNKRHAIIKKRYPRFLRLTRAEYEEAKKNNA